MFAYVESEAMTGTSLPLQPVRKPWLFYGWYVVGIALIAQFVSAGTQTYAASVFLKPMTEDLGWSRSDFSSVQTISTFTMGMAGLYIGAMVDRRGPRLLMFIGGVVCGAAIVATSQVHHLWQFYIIRGVAQTLGNAMLGNLVVNVTVARWFVARRGMAVSIASAGVSLGGVLMSPVVAWWVSDYGWREAWVLLGISVWILILPSAFVIRRSPEAYGMHPDGMTPEEAKSYSTAKKRLSSASEVQWTRAQALRTKTIWLIILAYGIANIGLGALLLHQVSFLSDHGWSRSESALLFSIQAWIALLSKPAWGILMDRWHARHLSAVGFGIAGVSILLILGAAQTGSTLLVGLSLAAYGLGIGGVIPLQETVWASYFGRTHLGKIRSVALPFSIVFSAGGPLLAGFLFDQTGSYNIAFILFTGFYAIGIILVLLARPPKLPGGTSTGLVIEEVPPVAPAASASPAS